MQTPTHLTMELSPHILAQTLRARAITGTTVPMGIFITQYALPWGVKSLNKIEAKWKQRIKERVKQREWKEASNP